ncbi:MAG TPA: ABC transporter substrate-binding protein [Ornithinibacter sp.]|nr:ABC transporter substrate-binding protein [Ornithinibacter sp.]
MAAVALLAAGCGSGDSDESETTAAGKTGGEVVIQGCNPENPLVPSATSETCGGNVIDEVFAKLVHYDPETAAPSNDVAESIETSDNQNFTVKLKEGYKFHDGTDVKAKNFVDAWNYAAYGPNAQGGGYFMSPIEGFADLQCTGEGDDPCAGAGNAKADKMSGLVVVDDTTFTIKTSEKVGNLPVRLGYSAFAPLPDVFFTDPVAFGDKPIGNGPFKLDSWTKEQSIVLSKFADYSGEFAGTLDKVTFKIYLDADAAYNDLLANNLDIANQIPPSALIDDKYKADLPERNTQREAGGMQYLQIAGPEVDPSLADPKIRSAISMAIDRDTIIKQIFNGARVPATGWVSPVVDGFKADQCGESCVFDPEKAKAKLAEAGGYKGDGLTITYNAEGGHKEWTEASCNSIKQTLGIECTTVSKVDFATMLKDLSDRKVKGMWRLAWQMDYPSIENFLTPIYGTNADSNYMDYSNPAFDQLLVDAAAATDPAQSNALYQEAEALLAVDLPVLPMWYTKSTMGWSEKVATMKITAFGTIDLASVTLK